MGSYGTDKGSPPPVRSRPETLAGLDAFGRAVRCAVKMRAGRAFALSAIVLHSLRHYHDANE